MLQLVDGEREREGRGGRYAPIESRGWLRITTLSVCGRSESHHFHDAHALCSRVVSVLDLGAEGHGFKSHSRRCRLTVLGKLFTPIVPLFANQQNW